MDDSYTACRMEDDVTLLMAIPLTELTPAASVLLSTSIPELIVLNTVLTVVLMTVVLWLVESTAVVLGIRVVSRIVVTFMASLVWLYIGSVGVDRLSGAHGSTMGPSQESNR